MARLTKQEAKMHAEAVARLAKDRLDDEDKDFVRLHWQESAENVNSAAGAFFTPMSQALDFALEFDTNGPRIIDLCAGIGNLSAAAWTRQTHERWAGRAPVELVCVEMNAQYVDIGRKLLPEATWVHASIFDIPSLNLGHFDVAISNPPFGKIDRGGAAGPRYTGAEFEYHVIDLASEIAEAGAFIMPANSAPFRYSGSPNGYERVESDKYRRFEEQTGITLEGGIGVDTTLYGDEWHGVKVRTEHCFVDFAELRGRRIAVTEAAPPVLAAVSVIDDEPEEEFFLLEPTYG